MRLSLWFVVNFVLVSLWGALVLADSVSELRNQRRDWRTENELQQTPRLRTRRVALAVLGGIAAVGSVAVGIAGTVTSAIMSAKDSERAAREFDKQMEFNERSLCLQTCVTEWTSWSRCTQLCGGGTMDRTRQTVTLTLCEKLDGFECPHVLRQTSGCNEDCPLGGTPSSEGCSGCPKGREGTCCENVLECEYPNKERNSKIHDLVWPAVYRSLITYTCEEGLTLKGDEVRTCDEKGRWTGRAPTCERVKCTMPVQNDQVEILNPKTGYDYTEEVHYSCEDGYELRGPTKRTCSNLYGTGRWSGIDPTCGRVRCGDPGLPDNADRNGTDFKYGGELTYKCSVGYHLSGSKRLRCGASGRWIGRVPECEGITCEEPFKPKNGEVFSRRLTFGTSVSFTCDPGYNLVGNRVLQCTGEGDWSGTEPTCEAAICGSPGVPQHGSKDGSVYYYPHNVTFDCFNGYFLRGANKIMCQSDGTWSAVLPTCEPCPNNTYMADVSNSEARSCVPCPSHSYTLTLGSNSIQQCICEDGYTGEPGGPCIETECPLLNVPANGAMGECEITAGKTCSFTCNDGYILERGSSVRTCQNSGSWDGTQPRCSPCLLNTYKSDERSCLPCPRHSHTIQEAQMLDGCLCDDAYEGPRGGPCEDVDECLINDGHGPCQDVCQNINGSYICSCSIPGYEPDPGNKDNCLAERQCRNLTEVDAPDNGGLTCHWFHEENSQQCTVMCNKGYEFPSRVNNYESCGSTTGFTWTFQLEEPTETIPPCIVEFMPGFQMEANTSYFVRDCIDLNETEQEEVKAQFAKVLNDNGVCKRGLRKICDVKDMAIICGRRTLRRRKRGVMEELSSMDMSFDVEAFQIRNKPKDCPDICRFLNIPENYCERLCLTAYKRFLKAAVLHARHHLHILYGAQKERMKFEAASREFEPEEDALHTTEVISKCKKGRVAHDDICVPCQRGSYHSIETNECIECPMDTYQLFEGETVCVPCPEGSTTYKNGSLFCLRCPDNSYGTQCEGTCHCVHGTCAPVTGLCICESGWEGDNCDTDIPGCRDGSCYDLVVCQDVPAPGSGFQCGSCPPGMSGDGQTCSPLRYLADL